MTNQNQDACVHCGLTIGYHCSDSSRCPTNTSRFDPQWHPTNRFTPREQFGQCSAEGRTQSTQPLHGTLPVVKAAEVARPHVEQVSSPATVQPSEWRELGPEEVIQAGDEVFWKPDPEYQWRTETGSRVIGTRVGLWTSHKFRRRVQPPTLPDPYTASPAPGNAQHGGAKPSSAPLAGSGISNEYVLGFAFSAHKERLCLIRKSKPDWQRGKLNGVGGKVESGESKYVAMVREFEEETGLKTHGEQWSYYCRLEGKGFVVHCFATVADIHSCRTTEGEKIEVTHVDEIKYLVKEMIENLPWLIHLAVDHLDDERPLFTVAAYDTPAPFTEISNLQSQLTAERQRAEALLVECKKAHARIPGCSKPGCGYPDGKPCIGCGRVEYPHQAEENARLRSRVEQLEKERKRAEALLQAGRHVFNDGNPNGKTLIDFLNLWLDQARTRAETAERERDEAIHAGQQNVSDLSGELAAAKREVEELRQLILDPDIISATAKSAKRLQDARALVERKEGQ